MEQEKEDTLYEYYMQILEDTRLVCEPEEMATCYGVSKSTVNRWLARTHVPDLTKTKAIDELYAKKANLIKRIIQRGSK